MFDVECPKCHSPKAVLAYEHPWCYLCPQCDHVWDTFHTQPIQQTLGLVLDSRSSRSLGRSAALGPEWYRAVRRAVPSHLP
jgi:hypothetical protein